MTTPAKPAVSGTVIVGGVVAIFSTVLVAVVVLSIAAPAGSDVGAQVTALLAFAGTAITAIVTLPKVFSVDTKLDYLTNGGMDAKVRAGVADAVKPELLKPEYADEQLEADRAHRAAGPSGTKSPQNGSDRSAEATS